MRLKTEYAYDLLTRGGSRIGWGRAPNADVPGEVPLEEIESRLDERVKLVALNHVSNALGSVQPVKAVTELHAQDSPIITAAGTATAMRLIISIA